MKCATTGKFVDENTVTHMRRAPSSIEIMDVAVKTSVLHLG